ncbi:hypothetical protein SAMN04487891_10867 [Flagellimonas taeanensis]|jgi:hypothetical protein|uniref:Anti-sigma factor n=1 Tax=Flagellimonas taeanensis TaxID=1005926 RepID=A0A1M7A0A7_9FLAO|nr:hypothetical protein [Allomuricauda taeanensis]SFC27243.1 hypothetical protein SAMN04487891_10867 [Allomuricauda taeanensis]SHL36035.1 hypothetical protein SAMN05216293_3302 [Allomuricauda taeanensis]
MDNFERHIRHNAGQFDEHKADRAKMWAKIAADLKQEEPKVISLWRRPMFRIAASVLLLVGLTSFIWLMGLGQGADHNQYASEELMEIDMYYKDLVSYQVQLVKNNPRLTDEDKTEFLSFMDELDAEYDVLKKEMQKNLDNEQVLEAIVGNYKKRIELIENLLRQLNDSKKVDDDYGYTL